jgi:glycosyltransferase involved in cell wall biosynthesis
MRVLHVSQPRDGGVAAYVLAAARDQVARGWDVKVACPDGGRLADGLAAIGVDRLPWSAVRNPGREAVAEAMRLRALIDRVRPDAVHLHSSKAGLAGRLRNGRRRTPVLFQPHGWSWLAVDGPMRAASLAWERAAAYRTDLIVCVGDAEERQGRAQGVRGRYTVVRNGVDLTRFRPAGPDQVAATQARARQFLGLPATGPLAVCVGRLTRQKGQDVLLTAWPQVRERCPRAWLALVGDGDLPLLAAANVLLAGGVEDVRPWLTAADVVVLPSRWEGLSLTALEALAVGRSLVVSDIAGLAEAVGPGTGVRVPPDEPAALAGALAERLLDPARSRAEGVAAARHATEFDQRLTFDRLAAETAASVATFQLRGVKDGSADRYQRVA